MATDERKPDIEAIVDFLDAWRYCPVSSAQKPARDCLERAARELLATLPLKARAEAAEQRAHELREARKKDLDYCRTLDRDLTKALEKAEAAEAKLATAVEALEFYGDAEIYQQRWEGPESTGRYSGPATKDRGERARQALSEIEQRVKEIF